MRKMLPNILHTLLLSRRFVAYVDVLKQHPGKFIIKARKTRRNNSLTSASNPTGRLIKCYKLKTNRILTGRSANMIAVFAIKTDDRYFPAES